MFKEVLSEVVRSTDGGVAALIMGFDGIPVDHFVLDDDLTMDVEQVGMEYSVILKNIRNAAEMLDAGDAHEVAIKAERLITVIRLLNDEYFMAVTLKPTGNLGKARYLLRTRSLEVREALE
jgi:predicted regulator of Ras-like GTPase activity (Roadblock/LC7/MglB family)